MELQENSCFLDKLKKEKEVQKTTRQANLNLLVYEFIKSGVRPSKICKILNLKKTALQYYLTSLTEAKLINKLGYGVWEVTGEFDENKFKKTTRVAHDNWGSKFELLKQDQVRGHAFQFKLLVPSNLRNWNKRENIFKKKDIEFDELEHLFGGGQRAGATGTRVTTTVTNDTAQFVVTYNFTSGFAVTESGVLNAASTGDLLCRQVFSAINVANGDSLEVTWKIQVS